MRGAAAGGTASARCARAGSALTRLCCTQGLFRAPGAVGCHEPRHLAGGGDLGQLRVPRPTPRVQIAVDSGADAASRVPGADRGGPSASGAPGAGQERVKAAPAAAGGSGSRARGARGGIPAGWGAGVGGCGPRGQPRARPPRDWARQGAVLKPPRPPGSRRPCYPAASLAAHPGLPPLPLLLAGM